MATKPATSTKPSTIKCVFCQSVIGLAAYADHVQKMHSTAPAQQGATQGSVTPGAGKSSKPVPYAGPVSAEDFAGYNYLRGQDLPQGVNTVEIEVLNFVTVQNSRSPLTVSIKEVYGRDLFPINKTNIGQLQAFVGDDLKAIEGKRVKLQTYPVNNPTTNVLSVGLFVVGVD